MNDFRFGFAASSGDDGEHRPGEPGSGDGADPTGHGAGRGPGPGFGGPGGDSGAGSGSGSGGTGSGGSGGGGDDAGGNPVNPFGDDPNNPFAAMFGAMSPSDLGAAFQQVGRMLSYEGGPVNWDLAHDIARQAVAAQGPDPSMGGRNHAEVADAVRLADLWLDPATELPAGTSGAVAWSRAEWIEATLPVWRKLVDPVASRVVAAMGEVVPGDMQAMAGPLLGMMKSMGGAMFGAQVGQALGALAAEVVSSTDVGLPLGPAGKAALLPTNVAAFGSGLGLPDEEIRLYLALREAAYHRLFAHVPWLRAHLLGAVEAYARGITVDTRRLEEAVGQLDPTNPQALQEALTGGMFEPEETPQQRAALTRLETALALVEGWVDAVVGAAAEPHLPSADALRETVRRRRAIGGPAERTFGTLVGLELRPRRLREAARLWSELTVARGVAGRDAVWAHPDLLPTAEDLADPDGFVHREAFDLSELDHDFPDTGPASGPEQGGDPRRPDDDTPEGGDPAPGA